MAAGVDHLRVWDATAVRWGATSCEAPGCFQLAAVLCDCDEWALRGIPLCLGCADVHLERAVAWSLLVEAGMRADDYPDLFEVERIGAQAARGPAWWEHAGRTPEQWLREQGYYNKGGGGDGGE